LKKRDTPGAAPGISWTFSAARFNPAVNFIGC
jgi:hypothetical protein